MRFIKTVACLVLGIIVMQYLHELGHALMAKALGYDVEMTVNKVVSTGGLGAKSLWHSQLIAFGGPAVTVCLAVLAVLGRRRIGEWALIITFNALAMRAIAAAVSVSNPNDEAWLGSSLSWGMWTLPFFVCALLFGLFILVWRENKPDWHWYIAMWIGVSIGYSAIVLGERSFPIFNF